MDPLIFAKFVQDKFNSNEFIPLHVPVFQGNESKYVSDTINSTFVSSVGEYVNKFEIKVQNYLGVKRAIAVTNGTSALHISLHALGIDEGCEVLTQALTFVATANAISYTGAKPIFIDVDSSTLSLCPNSLSNFLQEYGQVREDGTYNKTSGKKISACIPMHTFGFMSKIDKIIEVCNIWGIPVLEDSSEAFGSSYKGKFAGTFGLLNTFSFNGNKIITSGGGGMICSNNEIISDEIKHLSTTAKKPHNYEYYHDRLGFNYRMPNINAALVLGQLERINKILESKKKLFMSYHSLFKDSNKLLMPPPESKWNYWLMSIRLSNKEERDNFLIKTNSSGVMTRPVWQLLFRLPMYNNCQRDDQLNAIRLEETIVNIPSSAKL